MFQTQRWKDISDFASSSSHLHLRAPHVYLLWESSSSHLHLRVPHVYLFWESSSSHLHLRVPHVYLFWESSSSHLHLRVSHVYLLWESSSSHLHSRGLHVYLIWESSSSRLHLRVPRSLITDSVNSRLYLLFYMFLWSQRVWACTCTYGCQMFLRAHIPVHKIPELYLCIKLT